MSDKRSRDPRNRLTGRVTVSTVRMELRRSLNHTGWYVVGLIIGALCIGLIISQVAQNSYQATHFARFQVADVRGVKGSRQEARIQGIPAGKIASVDSIDGTPVITVQIRDEYGPIYRDAHATLRSQSPLEDKVFDIVDRGTEAAGVATAESQQDAPPLPVSQTDVNEGIGEILQVFEADERKHLAALLDGLGGGLEDGGDDLRNAFVELTPFIEVLGRMSEQVSERGAKTRRLVRTASLLTDELARREGQVRGLVGNANDVLATTAASSPELEATLQEFPPTLEQLDSSFAAVRTVLPDVDQALDRLRPVAQELPAGLAGVRDLSEQADPAVQRLREPVRRLVPLARQLPPLSANLRGVVSELRPQVPSLDHATRSAVGCAYGIQRFFQWTPSVTKVGDARGPIIRGDFAFSFDTLAETRDSFVEPVPGCAPGGPKRGTP